MALRIMLDNQPEFYTNLDHVLGRVVLRLSRDEQVGSIVVKLEGEATTALQVPSPYTPDAARRPPAPMPGPPGSVVAETHKILYRVQQVFPDDYHSSSSSPYGAFALQPGEHEFPFDFKLPINNACSDPMAMSRIGGLAGGGGLFGMGGVRVMDGSKQLFLKHVTRTLPPSLTGFPAEAEIRYYIKVTVQRPGLLRENWRLQTGFKFLPIEPPRPASTGQETFARRPFTFRAKSPPPADKTRTSFFAPSPEKGAPGAADASTPSIDVSARLPHPPVFTCNKPIPLRLIAKKLADCPDQVYLSSFQMDLVGVTEVRSHTIHHNRTNRWVVAAAPNLSIPMTWSPQDEVGHELVIPDDMWKNRPLPNTIAPSFVACNLSRRYELEIRLGVSWGKPKTSFLGKDPFANAQTIFLPLRFAQVDVYSGITPPPELVQAAATRRPGSTILNIPPRLPPRASVPDLNSAARPQSQPQNQAPPQPPRPPTDPLYPPQLAPGQSAAPQDDAPPSYDEAMAENLSGPFDGAQARPAYSGVTNENAPSQMPEKS
ncbi:hypothetical protein G6O67_008632 [Ophiocordyceps sinensis]|uniref:Arrestin-like N-terminal domain-containing protein n=2 Tax=Ophiocordyceps sinensis TaxID=72228 RepID=A0A8H4PMS2_9HYPO|nr:hypothetical protein G6O67_008632 [Ophiocordyceps sinensis]